MLNYHLGKMDDEALGRMHEEAATELFKLILNLTMHLGPLATPANPQPKPEEVSCYLPSSIQT